MELFSSPWWSALMTIVLIDLVLAGDNAVVIALAARSLPTHLQKRAIAWGTLGAILVRIVMSAAVVWLLNIPGLMFLGGVGLLWIAYTLLTDPVDSQDPSVAAVTFWSAVKTIVIADALMGLDNVLGVAGAAHGSLDLVIVGLFISIPVVLFGSTLVLKLVERFPIIIWLGSAALAFTGSNMILHEPMLKHLFWSEGLEPLHINQTTLLRWLVYALGMIGILFSGWYTLRQSKNDRT